MAMLPDCIAGAGGACKHSAQNTVALFTCNGRSRIFNERTGLRVAFSAKAPASRATTLSSRPHTGIFAEKQQDLISSGIVTEKTWKELVLDSDIPVLVDFWAPWCGPCRMIGPLVDELAKQYTGRIRCLKLNTDDCPNIATEFGIRSIPTVLFFKRGERKETISGAVPKAKLTSTVEKFLDK